MGQAKIADQIACHGC